MFLNPKRCSTLLFIICSICESISYGQVLDHTTRISIEKGSKTTRNSYLIQINNKEQNWLASVQIDHSPNQKFSLLEASIMDKSGRVVRKLKKKDIITKNDISYGAFYQDDLIEEFDLYWNEYPYRIKYSYEITENEFVYIARWYPAVFTNVSSLYNTLQIELDEQYDVSMDYSDVFEFTTNSENGRKTLKWTMGTYKHQKPEVFSPPTTELAPSVTVVPVNFQYGVPGNSGSWNSFGAWLADLNRDSEVLPPSERALVRQHITGISDKKEIVKTLYHYLQDNTNYINVAIDVGGLKSYPATYVCQNKYGDCKALTTYMKALLKYADIESFYTIINAGANAGRINTKLPGQQFNHVILTVPLENDTIWLENTSKSSPFNYLGTFTQNRYALLINEKESHLVQTPKLGIEDVAEKRTLQFRLDDQGNGTVTVQKELLGKSSERYSYYYYETSGKDQKEIVLKDITLKNFECQEWSINKTNRDNKEISIFADGTCTDQFKEIGGLKVLSYPLLPLPDCKKPSTRVAPIRINYPVNRYDSIVYELSSLDRYRIQLPGNYTIESIFGKYTERTELAGHMINTTRHFVLYDAEYNKEDYKEFYSFIKSISEHQKRSSIVLSQK